MLRVAYRPLNAIWLIPAAVKAHARSHPAVVITLIELEEHLFGQALRTGRIDAGITTVPVTGTGQVSTVLNQDPTAVAVPSGHRLSRRARIALADLEDEPLIMWRTHADYTPIAPWQPRPGSSWRPGILTLRSRWSPTALACRSWPTNTATSKRPE